METFLINTESLQINQLDFLIRLCVTIGIGMLIGMEREHSTIQTKEKSFAGIRTFIAISLCGFVGALLAVIVSLWLFITVSTAVIALIGISYYRTSKSGEIGATTEFTALLVYLFGALVFYGHIQIGLLLAVLLLLVLSAKLRLHSIIGKLTLEELYAIIRFVVAAILILPFLPNIQTGPYGVVNPKEIGWIILLTSGIGFLGYLLVKFIGSKKGILIAGFAGGLISSTATTWIFAQKSKENQELSAGYTSAILAASSIMVVRIIVWIFLFNKTLANALYIPFALIVITTLACCLYYYRKSKQESEKSEVIPNKNPLQIQSAIVFGILYTLIVVLVSYSNDIAGERGILISSAIAGLTDIDAITISVTKLSLLDIKFTYAQNAILLASLSNTIVKLALSLWAGSKALRGMILRSFILICTSVGIGFIVLNYF